MNDDTTLYGQDEYFSSIERQFGLRRGGLLMLSPRDWQRVEGWQDAGIPLATVLQGINRAFDQFDATAGGGRKINSLSYCEQQVQEIWEESKELAAAGGTGVDAGEDPTVAHLRECAAICRRHAEQGDGPALTKAAGALEQLADEAASMAPTELDRRATRIEVELAADRAPGGGPLPLPRFSPWAV